MPLHVSSTMCPKHVEAWNKLIVKQKFCASSWLITEIKKIVLVSAALVRPITADIPNVPIRMIEGCSNR